MTFLCLVSRVLYQVKIWLNFSERVACIWVVIQSVQLRKSEITNLQSLSRLVVEDVLRLNVPVNQPILMNVLQCGHQLSKHLQHLLPCKRLLVHVISQRDPVSVLHKYHDVQAHKLFAFFHKLVYARSAVAVWVVILFFAAINLTILFMVVTLIAVFNLSSLFECNFKFLVEIVG